MIDLMLLLYGVASTTVQAAVIVTISAFAAYIVGKKLISFAADLKNKNE